MSRFLNKRYQTLEVYTPGEQPQDMVYIKLNTNESPYPAAPQVVDAIGRTELENLRLYSDPESKPLVRKLAEVYGVGPENVFVSNGSDDILNFAFMAFSGEPGKAVFPDITYAEKFGKEGAFITKCTAQLMRDFGSIQSPQNAFYLNMGLESLHVRMARHCENGQAVAEFLASHPKVETVHYCGLPGDPYHEVAKKYLPNGSCGVVSFELKGGRPAAEVFMKQLKLAAIETHVADARTCCLNPATSTHRQMTEEQLIAAGVPAGLVRMSCGLESKEDLIEDIQQALEAI